MKKLVLDTIRSKVIVADEVEHDGENYIAVRGSTRRIVPADKVAYIEDIDAEAVEHTPKERKKISIVNEESPRPAPEPVLSKVAQQVKLPSAFAAAVNNNLRNAPPPEPFDDSPSPESTAEIMVELIGSASGTFSVLTDPESYAADHVREKLVTNIFTNSDLKDSLKFHNVVGITKRGNLVTLDCRKKPPVQTADVNASVASLVGNLFSLASPVAKLPDLPIDGVTGENTVK